MQQLWLLSEMGELEPYRKRYFPHDSGPALERLFYMGIETSRSGPVCPYRAWTNIISGLKCDCEFAHDLVRLLGRNQPSCSEHRCPVRQVLADLEN